MREMIVVFTFTYDISTYFKCFDIFGQKKNPSGCFKPDFISLVVSLIGSMMMYKNKLQNNRYFN